MKRGRRKCGNKEKVFGCDLMEHLASTSQEIPHVLRSCSIFIEEHGIVDGIYRLSGVSSNTQKLRSEFDSEGSPDLYKDVYLQDIHCVSSLCKAYFRELPNPLLTYQLYDHFAEAVAVQLEDERLVKIKEVLKELPPPHFRTLEYLMKHLIRMATYSNQTNMHARNLAIVWAPNLLRSKDIEVSGFNGTAAFMEVRVQSIVVEFILTHVTQLFPESDHDPGSIAERRKSLPSPSILSSQDEPFFKSLPVQYPGNLSPGDGPPPMRPYHAIIDGTEKRKGSLKGRKWKSIFNLGGRLHDPRKKKYAPKEKEKNSLRPAKSMDSLSSGPYTQQDGSHPSPQLSPLVVPPTESGQTGGGGLSSGYAVTYRRTGGASVSMVSGGGGGAQGTYRSLDPGARANADKLQPQSQGMPSKADRRAGMHISGPLSVTVPLHITSGLALGLLQGGRATEEEQNQEEQSKKDKNENAEEKETEIGEGIVQMDEKTGSMHDNKEKMDSICEGDGEKDVNREDKEPEEARLEEREEPGDKDKEDQYLREDVASNEGQRATDRPSLTEEDYMFMKGVVPCPVGSGGPNKSLNLQSQEEAYPDNDLPLDFQDTFGFLDLMDMSSSIQINEFSVEPPAFEMEEYEEEDTHMSPSQSHLHTETSKLNVLTETSGALSNKSHSLPYKSYPFQSVLPFSSDEDSYSGLSDNDDAADDSSDLDKGEYEEMFIKSLPSDSHFQGLNWVNPLDQIQDIQCSSPANHSADINIICSNTVCSNEGDLSPLPLETELLNVEEEEKNEDISTEKDGEDNSDSEVLRNENEPVPDENKDGKTESTDNKDDTLTSSHKDSHSTEDENEEDTYFGPEPPSTTVEPSTSETSCTTAPVVNEEPASCDDQQESIESDDDIAESETIPDVTIPELQTTQSKTEAEDQSVKEEIILHITVQEQADGNELEGVVLIEEREVIEKDEEERDTREVEEKITKGMESEHAEGGKNDEGPTNQGTSDPVDEMEKESDMVVQVQQTYLENKGEEVAVEMQKEDSDEGVECDQQIEDGLEEEPEAQNDCCLEGVAELKEGSVPEELSEEDDRLLEDGEDRQGEKEKESLTEKKHEDPSTADKEKPLRPPRMKDKPGELGPSVGRTLIISKHKMYQVKSVPVVPPKPQHAKITAFRQQFQQRDAERQQKPMQPACPERQNKELQGKETKNEENRHAEIGDGAQNHDLQITEQEKGMETERERKEEEHEEGQVKKQLKDTKSCNDILEGELEPDIEEQKRRRGTWDGGNLRAHGQTEIDGEDKRSSCISMCFDEAVARATGKRYKEKESMEKERIADVQ